MKYLLDTHTLLWFLKGDKKLSDRARQLIDSPRNAKFLSIASLWEIAIKVSLEKLILGDRPPNEFGGFRKVVRSGSVCGFKRHCFCFENVKN